MKNYSWFKSYDKGVPHTLEPYPHKTWLDVFDQSARTIPDHTFMIYEGRYFTYRESSRLFDAMASVLQTNQVIKGDCVATMLLNTPQLLMCLFGSMRAGAVFVPLNPFMSDEELVHALTTVNAEVIVAWDLLYSNIKRIQERTKLRTIIVSALEDFALPESKKPHNMQLAKGDLWLDELINGPASDKATRIKLSTDDTAAVFFSGGTTGSAKGAMLSYGNLMAVGLQLDAWNGADFMTHDDVTFALMPMFHVYGCNGILGSALCWRSPLALIPNPRDIDHLLDLINQLKPAFMPGVPTIFNGIMANHRVQAGQVDFSSLKLCMSAATPIMKDTKQNFEKLTGARILEAYGMTEATVVITINPFKGKWKEGSVGLPLPDVVVKFVDVEKPEAELPYGKEGEIVVKGPQVMQGYWNNMEETTSMIKDGWLYTGDVGYMDEDGYLFLTSRKKELIKPSGHQVWPREVEEILAKHPSVIEVCVAGIPDPIQTEAVKAWVVLKEGTGTSIEELQAFCREKLTSYKSPKHIEFRQSLPKSTVGKILRRVLQEEDKAKK
jgi:long-chain acyl-CoA synthetase